MLEGRARDGGADRRDRSAGRRRASGSPGLALAGQDLADVRREASPRRATRGCTAWPEVWARWLPASKFRPTLPTRLATIVAAALHRDVEIGQHDLARRAGVAALADDVEVAVDMIWSAVVVAGRTDVGDRRGDVDRRGVAAARPG